ncbi:site-2 protease family protein [Streptomyces sp. NPDC050619]|uniref:site-2 protease family protein n=1 Tax=Streptomyces sp. NPDC050619 TaxID=3157214 RepID=UPI003436DE9F
MDESGGSGQPRSGNDESTERHATPATPATGPTRSGPPSRTDNDADTAAATPPDEPTMVVRRLDASPDDDPGQHDAQGHESKGRPEAHSPEPQAPGEHGPDPQSPASEDPASGHPAEDDASAHDTSRQRAQGRDAERQGAQVRDAERQRAQVRDAERHDTEPRSPRPAAAPAPTQTPAGSTDRPAPETGTAADGARPGDSHADTPDRDRRPAHTPGAEARPSARHTDTPGGGRTPAHADGGKERRPRRDRGPGGGLLMGRPFGVPVYVAPSWFLVAALITWVFGGQLDRVLPELGAARYLVSLFFAVAFYASVLVHELAHTVAALRFKLPVRRIQLQFFGGVSEIEKEAETPGREFWLAFVGPLLSLVLSGLFYLAMQPVEPGTVPGVLLAGLMISNLIVAAFNLLPGLPLDGGRMLRAVVWKITGRPMSGTVAAAWVGRALAVCVLIGLPLLTQTGALGSNAADNVGMDTVMDALLAAILAAIIWTGAGNSLRMARLRQHLPELRARNLTRRAVPVETDTPLSEALRRANAAGARALVVVDADGHPVSLVREAAIVGVPEHRRPWVAVSGLAQDLTDGMRVSAELAGEDLLDALRATPATEYLVVEETGEIYGVLSAADVERAFVKAMARPSAQSS